MDLISTETLNAMSDHFVSKATDTLVPALQAALKDVLDGLTVEISIKVTSKAGSS